MAFFATVAVQMEFSGVGAGWTDVSADLRMSVPIQASYGIQGSGPKDRVASTGTMRFALDNSQANSVGLVGYYSPNHANVRSGFGLGIRCRLALTYSAVTYYKFLGVVDSIMPQPGTKRDRLTFITAVDWMDEAAKYQLTGLATQINKRSDQIFSTVLAAMPKQPQSTTVYTGRDTYPYALDNTRDENMTAMGEFQRLAQSELGFVYVMGDTTNGGRLVYEDRQRRVAISVNSLDLFSAHIVSMECGRARSDIINKVQCVAHPRRVDTSNVILYSLQSQPAVAAGVSLTLLGPYVDPAQRAARVGGTSMVVPVATTDYTMNTLANGTGTDLTGSFAVVADLGGNGVRFTITNNSGVAGFITKLQVRGLGLYDYEHTIGEATDTASKTAYGEHAQTIDMWYQSDAGFASEAARYLLGIYKDPLTNVTSITFCANLTSALMFYGLSLEISSRFGIVDDVTGVSTANNRGFYINSIALTINEGGVIWVTWTGAPADSSFYWILGQVGASELNVATRLGL